MRLVRPSLGSCVLAVSQRSKTNRLLTPVESWEAQSVIDPAGQLLGVEVFAIPLEGSKSGFVSCRSPLICEGAPPLCLPRLHVFEIIRLAHSCCCGLLQAHLDDGERGRDVPLRVWALSLRQAR